MSFPIKAITVAAVLCAIAVPARADVFVWRNPDTKLTLSFPDTWRQIHNQQPDDIFTVAASGDSEFATCRIRVREDRRFVVYPRFDADEIQRLNFSHDFWDRYAGELGNSVINGVWDNAGLGDGFASFADVSFVNTNDPKIQKRGIMFATNYNGKDYIAECSSEASAYDHWYKPFLSFVKSVDFRDEYAPYPNGEYRDYLSDEMIRIRNRKDVDLYTNF